MKKNPIPVIIPMIALLVALVFLGGICNSSKRLTFSIENRLGSYYVVGEYKYLESVRLSDGKKVKIDNSTGEIITCSSDDGIDSFKLSWRSDNTTNDTILAQSSDGKVIKLDHTAIKSISAADCPPKRLSEVEFKVTGPDKDCMYNLQIAESIITNGYSNQDILVSISGQIGPYTNVRTWKRDVSGAMDIWVKSKKTGQELAITVGRKYKKCDIYVCGETTKNKLSQEIKKALNAYILDYKNRSLFANVSSGKRLVFIKNGKTVQTSTFMAEVGVNGGNMKYGGSENTLEVISVSTSDCLTFKIKYNQK